MKPSDPSTANLDLQPGHVIRRLHQISVGIFLQELADMGVTPVQYAALQVVGSRPGIDQRTLARSIALDASTTGGVVDRLETRGWMARHTAPEDRRARQLVLTPEGEQVLAACLPGVLRTQELILAPLSERQRGDFMRLLSLLVRENNELSRAPSEAGAR
jgi:DNA-binding MarR family transcriptional regulator